MAPNQPNLNQPVNKPVNQPLPPANRPQVPVEPPRPPQLPVQNEPLVRPVKPVEPVAPKPVVHETPKPQVPKKPDPPKVAPPKPVTQKPPQVRIKQKWYHFQVGFFDWLRGSVKIFCSQCSVLIFTKNFKNIRLLINQEIPHFSDAIFCLLKSSFDWFYKFRHRKIKFYAKYIHKVSTVELLRCEILVMWKYRKLQCHFLPYFLHSARKICH